jgi:hypothetical protein
VFLPDRFRPDPAPTGGPAHAPAPPAPPVWPSPSDGIRTGVHWRPGPASAWTVADGTRDGAGAPGRDEGAARRRPLA